MRWLVPAWIVAASGCQVVFGLPEAKPRPDVTPDAAPDALPMCPADYTTSNSGAGQYRLVATDATFLVAIADCADDERAAAITGHTHLAVVSNVSEMAFLYTLGANRWLGLTDLHATGTWRWITAEAALDPAPSDAMLWAPNEPNNLGTEDCAHFDSQHPNLANNIRCDEPHTYACECDAFANDPSTYQ